jgi:hypothetical protein
MTEEAPAARDPKTVWIIILAIVVTVLLGAIIGYALSGGLSSDPEGAAAPTTTSAPPPTAAPSVASTTPPTTVATTTQPTQTDPPGQLTVLATEDTYTDASDFSEVNGFDVVIELEDDAPDVKQGLVRFDVVGIPEGVTIDSAELRLSPSAPSGAPIAVHLVDGDWHETDTSASNAPAVGDRLATIPAGGEGGEVLVGDLTGAVTGPGPVSFYLLSTTENTTEIFSRENGANGPSLVVRWTP